MKKLLSLLMVVLMLFSLGMPVLAEASEGSCAAVPEYCGYGTGSVPESNMQPVELPDGLYEYVVNKMKNCTATIDISGYKITADELYSLMVDITNSEPELFHLLNDWEYFTDYSGRSVTAFKPDYSMNSTEYAEALAYVRNKADKVVSYMDSSWTDLEKALYLHDYIIAWFEYDTDYEVRDIYTFLKTGEGVCEAYQLYYAYLLEKVNVKTDYIVSDSMVHVWNRVFIDGSWYNVDVTWDEPNNNHMAEMKHDYFLVSDEAMVDHYGGNSDKICVSKKYDNHSWRKASSAIVPLDGKWYTIIDSFICEYEPADGSYVKVYEMKEKWPSDDLGNVWADNLSGLSVYKGCLIYITPKSFAAYNPTLGYAKVLAKYTGEGFLFDGVVDQETGRYYVTVGTDRRQNGETKYFQIDDEKLPVAATWVEYGRDEATCINPGVIYYKSTGNASVTKTELIPAIGHTAGEQWYEVTDEQGNVTAHYQLCVTCKKKCNLTAVMSDDFKGRFEDVKKGSWYAASVAFAVDRGLFGGVSPTRFAPNVDMSRAMLVTVLWRLEGEPAPTVDNPFTDVPEGTWYTTAVIWAYENNIVGGIGNNKYAPNATITREQMATILYRYSAEKGYDLSDEAGIENFPDTADVSAYAVDSYSWARTMGIIDGMSKSDGKVYLEPTGYATRAQVATMLTRFMVYVCDQ